MRLPFQLLPVNQPDRADLAHFLHIGGVVPHPTNNVPQVSTIEDQFAVIDGVAALGTHALLFVGSILCRVQMIALTSAQAPAACLLPIVLRPLPFPHYCTQYRRVGGLGCYSKLSGT